MGPRGLRGDTVRNEDPGQQGEVENRRHERKPDEAIRAEDQSQPAHRACLFPCRLETKEQVPTIPFNH